MISVTSFYLLKFTAKPTSTNDTRIRESALTGCEDQKKGQKKNMNVYGVYDVNTDLPVCVGSLYDCCNYLGIKPGAFRSLASKQKHRIRNPRKYKILKLYKEDKTCYS